MTLAKVKEQDGMTLAKVKEQDGITLAKARHAQVSHPHTFEVFFVRNIFHLLVCILFHDKYNL